MGASAVVLRDLPDGDEELHDFLIGEGLLRIPVADSWVRDVDFATDDEFLAGLARRHRVPPADPGAELGDGVPGRGAARTASAAADAGCPPPCGIALYALYRAVHARALDAERLSPPPAPARRRPGFPGWEVVLLYLPDRRCRAGGLRRPARGGHPCGTGCSSAWTTRSCPRTTAISSCCSRRSARPDGTARTRVLYGMSADLHKARFGARREKRWAYAAAAPRPTTPMSSPTSPRARPRADADGQSLPLSRVRRSSFAAAPGEAAGGERLREPLARAAEQHVGDRHRQQQPEQQAGRSCRARPATAAGSAAAAIAEPARRCSITSQGRTRGGVAGPPAGLRRHCSQP